MLPLNIRLWQETVQRKRNKERRDKIEGRKGQDKKKVKQKKK